VLALAVLVACAVNPVTGRREFMLLGTEDEIALGQNADRDIVTSYGVYPDEEFTAFIEAMGDEMAAISHRPELEYTFRILDSPVINAFALPGGYVYMTRGILAFLCSEAELAGVVGHEIGHITARHSAQRYSTAQLAQVGLGIGSAISEDFRRYAGFAQAGVGLLLLRFGRSDERQADDLGVRYSTAVGYEAAEMANFFQTMEMMNPGSSQGLPGLLSTHPSPDERVETIRGHARRRKAEAGDVELKIGREVYLNRIDGIVYGDDPRQGYVADGRFLHPMLAVQFPIPTGWALQNMSSQIQIVDEKEEAIILVTLGDTESPEEEAQAFISANSPEVLENSATRVNGMPARRVRSQINSEDGSIRILSYFIGRDNVIYVFHGIASPTSFSDYFSAFENTMTGFSALTDPALLDVEPDRLRIRTVTAAGTLGETLRAFEVPTDRLQEIGYMNGMRLEDRVEAGSRIKVVEFNAPGSGDQ
jgi:predicted Zn-dependent protease